MPGPPLRPHKLPDKEPPDEEAEPGTHARPIRSARIGNLVQVFGGSDLRAWRVMV